MIPDGVGDGVVGHVVREGERGRDDGPSAEVGPRLGDGEPGVVLAAGAVRAAHLVWPGMGGHVRVRVGDGRAAQ